MALVVKSLTQGLTAQSLLTTVTAERPVRILGQAMYPTLKKGQVVIADTKAYAKHPPQRGDIVLFSSPTDATRMFIFRVIAVPGDRLRIVNGTVYINDQPLAEPYLAGPWTDDNNWPGTGQDQTIPAGEYFVMGDNRNHSEDSRTFGFVPASAIQGRINLH